jgi:uncharacterized protein YebE (UPF0316 family)
MDFLTTLPAWQLGLVIFFLRIVDVSMGTVRTLAVVAGHIRISVVLGFLEVLIWVFAISQVIQTVAESPLVLFMYAGGFATGNAVGILVERKLAMGKRVVRLISQSRGNEIAATLRESGQPVTTFRGEGRDGERLMIYFLCERKGLPEVIARAQELDPELFYVIEPVSESRALPSLPLPRATGWRAWMKQK